MDSKSKRRVVVTGLGVIASNGIGADVFFNNCLKGRTNVKKIPSQWKEYSDFACDIWSPLEEPDFTSYGISEIEQKQLDKTALLALSCSFDAVKHGGLKLVPADRKRNTYQIEGADPERSGVFIGTGIGGVSSLISCSSHQILNNQKKKIHDMLEKEFLQNEDLRKIHDRMLIPKRFNPFSVSMIMQNAAAANVAIRFGLTGINSTISLACASGTGAIGRAYEAVKYGKIDFSIAGGVEYMYDEYGGLFYSFDILKTLCKPLEDMALSNRPFDRNRTGFLYSQGGCAILIIEELDHAVKRNAEIYAEISAFSESSDAYNIMMMEGSGVNIERMTRDLLNEAGITPGGVDYINAHGTGTILNDEIESAVIEKIFGDRVLINSTKSLVGHTLGASGAIEALVTVMSVKNKKTHACRNLEEPVKKLNFIRESSDYAIKTALSQSFGFGGHNAALMFKEFEE